MASALKMISRFASRTMNSSIFGSKPLCITSPLRQSSTLTSICRQLLTPCSPKSSPVPSVTPLLISQSFPQLQVCRTYKVKTVLKRRCASCYFVRRHGRLFVECKAKPRHKQMQRMARRNLFKDDYTIGTPAAVKRACFYGYRHDRYYDLGINEYSRRNWLEGKIGRTV